MDYFAKKQWIRIAVCAVLVALVTLALTGVFGGKGPLTYTPEASAGDDTAADAGGAQGEMLSAIALSMGKEQDNSYVTDYLKQDPYLVNIYEGYGFAKDYGSARGHSYTLEDVQKTQRPHAKANCLTCKTPDMHKMIEEQGVSVYSMPFEDVMAQTTNPIACYTCHGADDGNNGKMVVTHQYVNEALGENAGEIKAASLACGQCHIEYYFTPEDSEAMMPYHSVAEMTPEAILAYYDELGFSDWEQPGTGTKMLKAQHPELETYLQGVHASILSCADCHMAVKTTESGLEYHDHHLVSPLGSETILNKCAECHGSGEAITARVREIQAKVTGRETEVGNRLSALKDTLTAAVEGGSLGDTDLEAVRKLHREAQWFFDYCYVENSEGAHNSRLATSCLDTADAKITEAMELLAAAGVAVPETAAKPQEEAPADGRYTEQGFGGDVTVLAELNEDGTVKSLTIETPNETAGLGQRASEPEFAEQFIGKAGPFTYGENGIEALSGATVTSTAALKAINRAVSAGSGETQEEPAQEKTEEPAPGAAEAPAEKQETKEEPAGEKASDGQAYGAYRAVKQNDFSTVTVIASTKNGRLTDVKILSEGDEGKDLLTDEIRAEWAKAILDSQSADPDAITGATLKFSAGSVTEAMTEILDRMAGETTSEPAAEPANEKQEAPAEQPEAKEEPAKETSGGLAYSAYKAVKQNDFSTVTVIASAKNGELTDVKILSEGEDGKDLLTDEIRTEWAKAILESGNAAPEAVSGATLKFSAGSVTEAMTEILDRMAGGAAAETTAEPEEEKQEAPAEKPETNEEPAKEEKSSGGQAYGAYKAVRQNDFSTVTVIASTKNGELADVKILSEGEEGKDLLTDEIRAEWAKAILDSQSANPDAITGATLKFSAGSVTEAMTEILDRIAGKEPEAAAEEPEKEPEAVTETTAEQTAETEAEPTAEAKEEAASETVEEPAAEEPEKEPEAVTETAAETEAEPAAEAKEEAAPETAEEPAPETKEEPAAEAPAKTAPAFAGYRAESANDFSKVTVIAFAKNGVLTDVKILSEGEEGKDLLTDEIRAEWAKAILESQSANPDAITGATLKFSAGSVQEAAAAVLDMAAGK